MVIIEGLNVSQNNSSEDTDTFKTINWIFTISTLSSIFIMGNAKVILENCIISNSYNPCIQVRSESSIECL